MGGWGGIHNVHDMLSNNTETHKPLRGLQNRHLPCQIYFIWVQTEHQTLLNSDMQIPAFSIFCELWIHGSRIALLCLESCRAFSSWHSHCFNPALDEFWRCSGETLDAAPPPLTQDEWRNIAAEHIKDKFILHVDGATAYNVKPDGVEIRKDSVDHRCRNGEPYFVKEQFTSISVISVGATKEKPS